jgi:hypothetical protein
MFYYKITADTPFCGTNCEDYVASKEELTPAELDEMAEEFCRNNAESYEYLVTGWDDEMLEDMTEEEQTEIIENYYADCDGSWEQISKEEFESEMGVDLG